MDINNAFKLLQLIGKGYSLKDKIALILYFPMRLFYNKNSRRRLIWDVTLKTKEGIFCCGDNISPLWGIEENNEKDMKKYFDLREGIFIDIGANIGKYSVRIARQIQDRGKVISFEPMPGNFEILKKNVELNQLRNVILFGCALGNKNGISNLYLDKEGRGGGAHSLVKDNPNTTNNKITVQVKKLDEVIKDLKLNRIDLIKIDVEGFESKVLQGGSKTIRRFHPKIIFEAWNDHYLDKVRKILLPLGYKIEKIAEENYFATSN